ncbi:MAG TPA: hypothetical protein VMB77_02280 [Syntrophales bacterium]|nr:hypothetical protein [Syntrophales bacterium]
MKRLCIRAGKQALQLIRDGGFRFDRVTTYVGPAVGPRWLAASGFDLTLLQNKRLGSPSRPVLLTGSSAGAWRFAAWLQPEPEKSYRRLLEAYIGISFDRRSTPASLKRSLQEVINSYLEDDAIPFALSHDHYRLAVTTARSKNLTASETSWIQKSGLALCHALNRLDRKHLFRFFDRVIFYSGPLPPQFCFLPGFRGTAVALKPINFKHAVLASGAIPLAIEGVTDIYGAPRGVYRDGGIIDYHLDHRYAMKKDDVTLLFHHENRIIPGWLDRNVRGRRPAAEALDNLLMICPSPQLVDTFPGRKLPDRDDFLAFIDDAAGRILNWRRIVEICAPLGEEFSEQVQSGKIRETVEPLNLD